jgi:hypothetical protein
MNRPQVKTTFHGYEDRINRLCQVAFNDFSYAYILAYHLIKIDRLEKSELSRQLQGEGRGSIGKIGGCHSEMLRNYHGPMIGGGQEMGAVRIRRLVSLAIRFEVLAQLLIKLSQSNNPRVSLGILREFSSQHVSEEIIGFFQEMKDTGYVPYFLQIGEAVKSFWESFSLYHSITLFDFDNPPDLV